MSLAETAFQACSFIRPRSRMSSARATARCPAEAAKPRRRTTTRIRRSRRHERASGVRFHHGLPQVGDQAWFHLHLRSIETGRAVLLGHKEPEPCQFASTAFWRPSQGSRVTSDRSSRAGIGCGPHAEASPKCQGQRLAPIMECQDATAHLANYLAGSLAVEEVEELLTHAAACAACRGKLMATGMRARFDAVLADYRLGGRPRNIRPPPRCATCHLSGQSCSWICRRRFT